MLEEIVEPLLSWYQENKRELPWRTDPTPYHVWVSEIMLQQTRVEAVKGYYARFLEALPGIGDLAECPQEKLLKLWEGLGYYNRVKNMQKAALEIVEKYGGEIPGDYEKILALPGIGSYTAGAIASIAYKIPKPAVDGNVLRVIARLTEEPEDILKQRTRKKIEDMLEKIMPADHPGEFNQSLMELGATGVINGMKEDVVAKVRELTDGKGTDLVIETAGSEITSRQAIEIAKNGSTIVFVGYSKSGEVTLPMSVALNKELTFKTVFRYRNIYPMAIQAVADGKVNLKGIVTKEYPLDQADVAMDESIKNKADIVKAVIRIHD